MSKIIVSIIIPTYNRKESIRKTLNSLFNQTYPRDNYEIIVCDDGSTDGTEETVNDLIKESPCVLRYFRQKNSGPAAARNIGLSKAVGGIIGFTDDDCVVSEKWIEYAVPYFNCKEVGGVMGSTLPEKQYTENILKSKHTAQITEDEGTYPTCNIFYKKNVLEEVHGFDTAFDKAIYEDTDLALRVKEKNYKIMFDKNILVYHNITYNSMIQHLKSLNKYESTVLFYKKYPVLKKNLFLGFITQKKHIYPIFIVLFIVSLGFGSKYSNLLLLFAILCYFWAHVFVDLRITKYPFRIILFIKHFIPDTVRLYFAIRGSIRYRYLLI